MGSDIKSGPALSTRDSVRGVHSPLRSPNIPHDFKHPILKYF
jgi:hypothetical protein